jgi:hypothetical protein
VNNVKFGVLVAGIVGLVACFLPFVSGEGISFSWWDMHHFDMAQTLLVMAGFGLGAGVAAASLKGMARGAAITSLVGFGYVIFKFRGLNIDMLVHGSMGARLMEISAIAGIACALLAVLAPAKK